MTDYEDEDLSFKALTAKKDTPPAELSKREASARLKAFRNRLLSDDRVEVFIESLFEAALDPECKERSVAMKILSDRILPSGGFTSDQKSNNAVSINITGLTTDHGVVIDGSTGEPEDE